MYKLASLTQFAAAFTVASAVTLAAPHPALADTTADITRLEKEFNDAYAANDFDKYFGFYTEDAVFWFPEGRTDMPGYKQEWSDFLKDGGGIEAGVTTDMQVKLSPKGDTAIASYVLRLTTRETNKKVHTENYQESDIWFQQGGAQQGGAWKITHVHYSLAPKPKPAPKLHKPHKKG